MFRLIYTISLLLISVSLYAQNPVDNEWYEYILEPSASMRPTNSPYYLVKTEQASLLRTSKAWHIVRTLDKHHVIIYSQSKPSLDNSAVEQWHHTNDLWKLAPSVKVFEPNQTYIIQGIDHSATKKLINRLGITILRDYSNTKALLIKSPAPKVMQQLLSSPDVTYISRVAATPSEESILLDNNHSVNQINYLHHNYPSINGEGHTMAIKEWYFNEDDLDFKGRIIPSSLAAETTTRHATEMATITSGAGNTSPNSMGVAWHANLISSDFENLFPDDDSFFINNDIYIQNHSYGTAIENFYGAYPQAYDQQANTYESLLHVFSVGNNGTGVDTAGTYKDIEGFANLTGSYKMAKNIITVGSIDTLFSPDPFVSSGPAYDGRLKPEISAYSTGGSSAAAALVSGTSLLLQQQYEMTTGEVPNATLVKGILLNSADDVGPEGIDFHTGYGSLNAYKAYSNLIDQLYDSSEVDNGQTITFDINLPANVANFKVMLVWNDPAATTNANQALVNDLDLQLKHNGSGEVWLSWVLNSYPHVDSLTQLPTRKADHLNNVEQVTLDSPQEGIYTVSITGYDIPVGPQKFFITYNWELENEYTWTYPTGSDNLPEDGERTSFYRWMTTFEGQGKLEYSTDNGNTWIVINDNVDVAKEYYSWTPPNIYTSAIAKMTIQGQEFISDKFSISQRMRPRIGFNCQDSVMILWDKIDNASGYNIYSLADKYLEVIYQTTDTVAILKKDELNDSKYAVAPVFEDNVEGLRSLTFDYNFQGVDCYLSTFFAFEDLLMGEVDLNLTLGTNYQVDQIVFERATGDEGFSVVNTVDDPASNVIIGVDANPVQGLSYYRAKIDLQNGVQIISDTALVYFLTERPILVFPNPASQWEDISVFTRSFYGNDASFELFNTTGQRVLEIKLQSEREFIPGGFLKPGLYNYRIRSEGVNHSGKMVIQ